MTWKLAVVVTLLVMAASVALALWTGSWSLWLGAGAALLFVIAAIVEKGGQP